MTTRVGILGFGLRSGLAHYAHQPARGSRVVAVCDPDLQRLRAAGQELGDQVRLVPDLDALFELELDALMILTPDHLHEEHAVRALDHGIPTFLEKPMAVSTEAADRILATAYRTGTRLYVGHNMRHMPVITAMRDAVLAGRVGEVRAIWCRHFVSTGGDYYFKDWHADRSKTLGLLLQKGAHDIDVIHWLGGGYATTAQAMGRLSVYGDITDRRDNRDRRMAEWYSTDSWPPTAQRELAPVLDVEDLSMANFALDNGVLASYQQCHFTPDYWRNYTVIGTAGRIENFGDGTDATVKLWNTRSDTYRAEPDELIPLPAPAAGGHGGADPLLVKEFLRFARDGGPTMTSPVAARHAVAAGAAATSSLRAGGQVVPIPPLRPEIEAYFEAFQARR
ncbi:MAG: Gfo/Idh/MocA family protein [Friedmanniella sp.]